MRKIIVNKKGFTLAEELVTVILIGILIVSASGIMLNALRIFCQNVISLTAQEKGLAVMEQLEENLEYAKVIKNTVPTSGTQPYVVELYTKQEDGINYLMQDTSLKYSSSSTSADKTSTGNKLCKLGTYEAVYTIEKADASGTDGRACVVVDLKINRNGTTYYSEKRTVELKNNASVEGFSFNSSSDTLYLEFIE